MKKYILTESQIKKVIDNLISEQPKDTPNRPKFKGSLKTLLPSLIHYSGSADELKKIYLNPSAKFKVMSTHGEVYLNGKYISSEEAEKRPVIITPQTTIEMSGLARILMSGMGQDEAEIYVNDGKLYFSVGW